MPDFIIKQGDAAPVFNDTLTYSDGTAVNLAGATVTFAMRSLSSAAVVPLAGVTTIENPFPAAVSFTPTVDDTATPGNYEAEWKVVFSGGVPMTFPTDGYLWVEIQPSVTNEPQQLVSVGDAKQWMRMPANQRDYDYELQLLIEACRPEVENITGPILPTYYDEWYDGGSNLISLRNRPSSGPGTSPFITIVGASEYRGPIEYPLALVASPVFGSIYSVMQNVDMGTITRRSAGGGTVGFMPGREQVHVVYVAGQRTVPTNVRLAVLEIVRVNFRTTADVGTGLEAAADTESASDHLPFWIPRRAREMLAATRRGPSSA